MYTEPNPAEDSNRQDSWYNCFEFNQIKNPYKILHKQNLF